MDEIQVTELVFAAVDEVNKQLRKAQRLDKSLETVISGAGSQLDSLGLVNLIFSLEQRIEQQYGVSVTLVEESTLSREENPFRTLASLAQHVHGLLEKKLDG